MKSFGTKRHDRARLRIDPEIDRLALERCHIDAMRPEQDRAPRD